MVKQDRGFSVEAVKDATTTYRNDREQCRLQGNDANKPWKFLDMLGTARAWAQQVERCCANALDFVEPHMDDRETKEMLSRVEQKV